MRVSALFYAVLATLLYLFGMWWSVPLVLALASGITFALSHFVIRRFLRAPPPPAAAVFITGTSTGFGRMFTYDLASKGLLVFAGVRKTADGEALVQGAPEAVRQLIHPVNVDVTNDEHIRNAVESVRETLAQQHRKLYAVVNNAGYGLVSPLELLSKEAIQQQFAVNVFGAIEVTRSFLPLLRDYGAGSRVVFISSVAGLVTVDMIGAYSASKYAVEAVSDAFRGELAHWGIKVSVIEPGAFKTGFQDTAKVQLSSTADDDTHSDAVHEHYRTRAKKLAEASAKAASKFPSGEPVVDTLDYCLFGKFPPARVLVGVDGLLFGPLGGFFLPDSVMDLIKRYVIPY